MGVPNKKKNNRIIRGNIQYMVVLQQKLHSLNHVVIIVIMMTKVSKPK